MKEKILGNSNLKFLFLSIFVFCLSVNFASAQNFVYLKTTSGVLVGKISYTDKSFLNQIKINSFCLYQKVASGVNCEFIDETSPIASDPNQSIRLVTVTKDNSSALGGLWNAIFGVDKKVDNLGNQINFVQPPVIIPDANVQNIPNQPTTIISNVQPTTPAPSSAQNVVYQIIERAVPGPRGEQGLQGPAGRDGSSGSAGSVSYQTFPGNSLNQIVTTGAGSSGNFVTTGSAASLSSVSASGNISAGTLSGAGLSACNSTTSKIVYNSTTTLFECAVDLNVGTQATTTVVQSGTNILVDTDAATNTINLANNISLGSVSATGTSNLTTLNTQTTYSSTTNSTTTNTQTLNTTNISASGSSTLGSTTVSNITGNTGAFQSIYANLLSLVSAYIGTLFGSSSNFAVSNASTSNATTSNAITFNGTTVNSGTVNSGIVNGGTGNFNNLNATGSAQLTNVFASTTNSTTTNVVTGNITNLNTTNGTLTNATVTNLSAGNINLTNINSTNGTITNSTSTNSSIANLSAGSTTLGSTTVTNILGNILSFATAFISTLNSTLATITTLWGTTSNFATSNASTTNATTSNAVTFNGTTVNGSTVNGGTGNFTNLNATGSSQLTNVYASTTNASTTNTNNLVSTNSTSTNSTTTNLFASNAQIQNASTTNLSANSATITNATVTGTLSLSNSLNSTATSTFATTTAASGTITNFNSNNATINNVAGTNSTFTNSTSTNLFATNASLTNATATSLFSSLLTALSAIFTNLTSTNATLTNATSTNLSVSATTTTTGLESLYARLTSLFSTLANITTLNASTTNASTTNTIDLVATNATLTNFYTTSFTSGLLPGNIWIGSATGTNVATSTFFMAPSGLIGINTNTPTGNFSINQGILTGSNQNALDIGGTWNNAASIFNGIKLDITNTNSNSASNLLNLAVGGVSQFRVSPTAGTIVTGNLGVTGTTTINGGLDVSSQKIVNLALPTNTTDAANKAYVDGFVQGILYKNPVIEISTTTISAPSAGDRYIIGAGSSGSTCTLNQIAEYTGTIWSCEVPATGTSLFVDNGIDTTYNYNGTNWVSLGSTVNHANLIGLQGGQAGEYYHLKYQQYQDLNNVNSQLSQLQTTGTATQFVNLYLTGGLNISGAGGGATITNATFTNIIVTNNSSTTNSSSTNGYVTNQVIGAGTSTSFFSSLLTALNAIFTNLTVTNGYISRLFGDNSNFYISNASTTYASTSNATNSFVTNLQTDNATLTNATVTNLSVTTLSAPSVAATNATFTNSTTTNIFSTNASVTNATTTNNFSVNSSSSNSTSTNLFVLNSVLTNIVGTNSTITNSTSTNTFATNASITNATTTNLFSALLTALTAIFTNLTATNATLTNATSTTLSVSNLLTSLAASFTTMFAQTGYFTNLYASTTNASTSFASTSYISSLYGGTATLTNATVTGVLSLAGGINSTATSTFATTTAASSSITTLNAGRINVATVTATALTSTYATLTAATSTDLYSFRASITNSTATNFFASLASLTNATSSNLFSNFLTALTGLFTSLTATNATLTNATTSNLSIGNLTGILQAVNGKVTATSTVSISSGGTGTSTAPTQGYFLVGNAAGGYDYVATSTLGIGAATDVSAEGLLVNSVGTQSFLNNTGAHITDLTNVSRNDFGASSLSAGVFTVPTGKAGWYIVSGSLQFSGGAIDNSISILVNGSFRNNSTDNNSGVTNGSSVSVSGTYYLNVGDNVRLSGFQQSGGSKTISTASNMSLVKISTSLYGSASTTLQSSFSVHRNGVNQTVVDSTTTQFDPTVEVFDTNNNFDLTTNRFTPTVPGKYLFVATAYPVVQATGQITTVVRKNGASAAQASSRVVAGGNPPGASVSIILEMNGTTDYVDMAFVDEGGTTISGTASLTNFSGSRVDGGSGPWTQASSTFAYAGVGSLAIGTSTYQNANSLYVQNGISIASSTPTGTTTNTLYAQGSSLYWNGAAVGTGSSSTGTVSAEGLYISTTGSQSIPNAVQTAVTSLTNVIQNDFGASSLSAGAFTVPAGKAGWYQISGSTYLPVNITFHDTTIRVNGNGIFSQTDVTSVSSGNVTVSGSYYLNVGDIVQLTVYQNSGSAANVSGVLSLVRLVSSLYGTAGSSINASFSAHRNGVSQTVTNSADTKLLFTTENFDTNNNFDTTLSRFTPTVAGKYLIDGGVTCNDNTGYCSSVIYKNGGAYKYGSSINVAAAPARSVVSAIVDMNGTSDYVELYAYNAGGTVVLGSSFQTSFSGSRIDGGAGPFTQASSSFAYSALSTLSIGTTTQVNQNSLYIGNGLTFASSTASTTSLSLYAEGSTLKWNGNSVITASATGTSGYISYFGTNQNQTATSSIFISTAGNIGIGTTTPAYKTSISSNGSQLQLNNPTGQYTTLDFANAAASKAQIAFDNTATTFNLTTTGSTPIVFNTNSVERLRVDANGNLNLGATAQLLSSKLGITFNGSSASGQAINDAGAIGGSVFTTFLSNGSTIGSITNSANSGVLYNTTSDRRLKENFATSSDGLDKILKLNVYEYNFIADQTHKKQTGFVAQEVYDIFPEAVSTNGDNGVDPLTGSSTAWAVDYGRITPLLVRAVQELYVKIQNLAEEVVTKVVRAQLLCLYDGEDDICMNGAQLKQILNNNNVANTPNSSEVGGGNNSTSTSTTTDSWIDENATTTNATSTEIITDTNASSTEIIPPVNTPTEVVEDVAPLIIPEEIIPPPVLPVVEETPATP